MNYNINENINDEIYYKKYLKYKTKCRNTIKKQKGGIDWILPTTAGIALTTAATGLGIHLLRENKDNNNDEEYITLILPEDTAIELLKDNLNISNNHYIINEHKLLQILRTRYITYPITKISILEFRKINNNIQLKLYKINNKLIELKSDEINNELNSDEINNELHSDEIKKSTPTTILTTKHIYKNKSIPKIDPQIIDNLIHNNRVDSTVISLTCK
uniref:Uncharacterized protein n=1 Tax=viral metagenome TaxID=1070528 RepID=A0A6C0H8N4_9ZZZZ